MNERRAGRKQQILEAFAAMLQSQPGGRITTAALAKEVGVSEAALYRHFPSKARMFEGLIEFIEESVFTRVPRIAAGEGFDGGVAADVAHHAARRAMKRERDGAVRTFADVAAFHANQ